MSNSRSILKALVVVAALIPPGKALAQRSDAEWLEECRSDWGDRRGRSEVYCEVRTTGVRSPSSTISMEGLRNGGVSVSGWSRDSMVVRTRIRVTARSQSIAREIAGSIRTSIRGSDVIVDGPRNQDDANWNASLIASVPQKSNLRVETRNGPVSISDLKGDIDATTSNGPLSLSDLAGTVRARTTNGPLSISLTGSRWDGSGLEARTTNGPLTISVPDGYNAHLEAGTTNGPVSLGFPITVVGRITRDISTDLGSGGATIRATTTNGPLSIRRR
jgi:DUF4097 and DUF4098 domain-containing protein YvlB